MTLRSIYEIQSQYGFSSFPVTVDGKMNSKLVGLITSRDIDFQTTKNFSNISVSDILVKDVMSKDLLTGSSGISLEEAYEKLAKSRKSKLPICDSEGNLVSLITLADLKKKKDFPLASINAEKNQLIVGAAISTRPEDKVRIEKLVRMGIDVVVLDSSQGLLLFIYMLLFLFCILRAISNCCAKSKLKYLRSTVVLCGYPLHLIPVVLPNALISDFWAWAD